MMKSKQKPWQNVVCGVERYRLPEHPTIELPVVHQVCRPTKYRITFVVLNFRTVPMKILNQDEQSFLSSMGFPIPSLIFPQMSGTPSFGREADPPIAQYPLLKPTVSGGRVS
jgi:hypothetical protein